MCLDGVGAPHCLLAPIELSGNVGTPDEHQATYEVARKDNCKLDRGQYAGNPTRPALSRSY